MNILFHNFHLKILALLLAAFMWVMIVGFRNPIYKFAQGIEIRPFNVSSELTVEGELGVVNIRVSTDLETFQNLQPQDFNAYVDLKDTEEGTFTEDITVTTKNQKVTIVSYEPTSIKVMMKPVQEGKFPVELRLEGNPMSGYEVDDITLSPKEVTVKASEATLEKLQVNKKVYADYQLTGQEKDDMSIEVSITQEDDFLKNVQITPDKVTAKITFKKKDNQKVVGIVPKIMGKVKNGVIDSITIEPATIMITGDKTVLDFIQTLNTENIDVKNLSNSQTFTVKLLLPEGIRLATGMPQEVKVNILYQAFIP